MLELVCVLTTVMLIPQALKRNQKTSHEYFREFRGNRIMLVSPNSEHYVVNLPIKASNRKRYFQLNFYYNFLLKFMLKLLHISSLNSYLTTNSKNTRPKYKKKELSSLWDDQERIRVSKQRSPSSSGANLSCAFSTETFFVEFSTHTA